MTEVTQEGLTIDELARRTGMTVRNLRAHQSRGLLPPPQVRGRTGYYDEQHVARVELIKELQADGFNLEAIRRLLAGVGDSSTEVLDFTRALRRPFEDEEPEIVEASEMAERWGVTEPDPTLLERAQKLGLLNPLGGGRFEVVSPRLQRAAAELAELGVPPEAGLEVVEKLRRHSRGVARVFIELFLKHVWEPFERAGRPDDQWPEVRDALERLRPLASESLLAIFQMAMSEAVEAAAGRVLQRQAGAEPRSKKGRRRRRRPRAQSSRK